MSEQANYVLVGGGVAAHRAAEEIRKADPVGTITLVSSETERLYSRVLLPHVLHNKVAAEKVFLIKPEWYAEHRVTVVHGAVSSVDSVKKEVMVGAKVFPYTKLLIATGGSARAPQFSGTITLPFRTLADTLAIQSQLHKLTELPESERIVGVYGAGFIAAEFINIFLAHKCKVHIIYRSQRFWGRQLDAESSALLESQLTQAGCVLHPNASDQMVQEFAPQLRCLGLGIGIVPNMEFLASTQVQTNQGIKVNAFQETDVQGIFAAGDIAEITHPKTGLSQVVGTWLNAEVQGRTAGKNMAGLTTPFNLTTSYATKILDINLTFIGQVEPGLADTAQIQKVTDPKTGAPGIIQKLFRSNQLIGASMVGTAHGRMEIQQQIASA